MHNKGIDSLIASLLYKEGQTNKHCHPTQHISLILAVTFSIKFGFLKNTVRVSRYKNQHVRSLR